jgi:hypothetical protein
VHRIRIVLNESELGKGAAFSGLERFTQQRHRTRYVPVGDEASSEPVPSAAQARSYLDDVHPIPLPCWCLRLPM